MMICIILILVALFAICLHRKEEFGGHGGGHHGGHGGHWGRGWGGRGWRGFWNGGYGYNSPYYWDYPVVVGDSCSKICSNQYENCLQRAGKDCERSLKDCTNAC